MAPPTRLRILLADLSTAEVEPGDDLGRLARAMRDAGHEVVFLGRVDSGEAVESIAVQEDVDATCLWDGTAMTVDRADDEARAAIETLLQR